MSHTVLSVKADRACSLVSNPDHIMTVDDSMQTPPMGRGRTIRPATNSSSGRGSDGMQESAERCDVCMLQCSRGHDQ